MKCERRHKFGHRAPSSSTFVRLLSIFNRFRQFFSHPAVIWDLRTTFKFADYITSGRCYLYHMNCLFFSFVSFTEEFACFCELHGVNEDLIARRHLSSASVGNNGYNSRPFFPLSIAFFLRIIANGSGFGLIE